MSIHPLHELCSRPQAGGFDHRAFPMDPLRFEGVEPRAFAGQGTPHNPEAVALPFALLVMLSEPLPHGLAAVPRRIIPHHQQGGFAHGGHLGAAPGHEGARDPTHRPFGYEAQPHGLLAHALGSPLLDEQALTGQGFGLRSGGRHGLLDDPQGLVRGRPGLPRGLRHATPPRLLFTPQRPRGMARRPAAQAVAGFFWRAYAGSGLVIQGLARCQLTSKRRTAVRIAARLTRGAVRPWAKLTAAANSNVPRLGGWPQGRGLWCHKACRRWAPAAPKRARVVWGRAGPRCRHPTPGVVKAGTTWRTVWSLPPTWRAMRGTPAPYSLARTIWQRRTRKALADRRPPSICWRSSGVKNRTNTEVCRMQSKIPHFPKTYPAKALEKS